MTLTDYEHRIKRRGMNLCQTQLGVLLLVVLAGCSPASGENVEIRTTPVTSPPTIPAPIQTVIPTQISAPIHLTEPSPQLMQLSDPEFSLIFFPHWYKEKLDAGYIFIDPENSANWLSIKQADTEYALGSVDERVAEEKVSSLQEEFPESSFSVIYPARIGPISNGRACDYVLFSEGQTFYGGFSVGSASFGETWSITWQSSVEDYQVLLPFFLRALETFDILSEGL